MISISNKRFRLRRRSAMWLWQMSAALPGEDAFKAKILKVVHEGGFWLLLALYFFYPAAQLPILLLFLGTWLTQITLGACVLTIIERKLSNDRSTIMDPWLRRFGLPCNHAWRLRLTLFASTGALLLMCWHQLLR